MSEGDRCEKENLPEVGNTENGSSPTKTATFSGSKVQSSTPMIRRSRRQQIAKDHIAGPSTSHGNQVRSEKKRTPRPKSVIANSDSGMLSKWIKREPTESKPLATETEEAPEESTLKRKISDSEVDDVKSEVGDESVARNVNNAREDDKDTAEASSDKNMPPAKKMKLRNDAPAAIVPRKVTPKPKINTTKCELCHQSLSSLKQYSGHPKDAVSEVFGLVNSSLDLFTDGHTLLRMNDTRPQNKITHYSVYDRKGHLCPFDTGLIEKNVPLYFTGYIKPIYEENSSREGGIPAINMGPILEWWVSGFDGGECALIGFSTEFSDYVLMEPSDEYTEFMGPVLKKIYIGKLVIEFLLDEDDPTYEDLINKLQTTVPPKRLTPFTEDDLLRHAQFVCDQIVSFDQGAEWDNEELATRDCIQTLIELAGVTFRKTTATQYVERRKQKSKKPAWTKATTTYLVKNVFESFFADQLDEEQNAVKADPKKRRCGVCEACQMPDCGLCVHCKDMPKFGGSGRSKQACTNRKCPNMGLQGDESDPENDDEYQSLMENITDTQRRVLSTSKVAKKNIQWVGPPIFKDSRRTFYESVVVGRDEINLNDCVLIQPSDPAIPLYIARVMYMFENRNGDKMFHGNWFCRGSNTVLGETSAPNELFLIDECEDIPFTSVKFKANVIRKEIPSDWANLGNVELSDEDDIESTNGRTFFYQKRYVTENARFEDPGTEPQCNRKEIAHRFCSTCTRLSNMQQKNIPKVDERGEQKNNRKVIYNVVHYQGEEFRVGSAVYILPGFLKFKYTPPKIEPLKLKKEDIDEDTYPEYYRKSSDHVKGSNNDTPEPFQIGYIQTIYASTTDKLVPSSDIWITVTKLYRPENTHAAQTLTPHVDLNMVYWSDEVSNIRFEAVAGKCYLSYSENIIGSIESWSSAGPHRFYFKESYNANDKSFETPSERALAIGREEEKKEIPKDEEKNIFERPPEYPAVVKPLRSLDVFAGCGGLTEGLHQTGVAECRWAIEKERPAAAAFRLNNPKAIVYSEDCNRLLRMVIDGEVMDEQDQPLPQRGEVELLCGGPPCQGFSGMNRFNYRVYSLFKNSLVVSYLSYCDYYRPRFFIMENVRNFVSFKNSMVLKLTLRCLVKMGYQCTFGVLQAGNYGVPQTRRRLIIMAAAPGEQLPKYPEPTHVFSKRACQLSVMVDGKKYNSNSERTDSAPHRTISVRDAMSDLPKIKNGWNQEEMKYESKPQSYFQRQMREDRDESVPLRDHICKEMTSLVEARMAHIPTTGGSDWRDLPNIEYRLNDGSFSHKLIYAHDDPKAGRAANGSLRGVCSCCTGKACDPINRQYNTLIPWCLPHTGNRHNHWAGLYGRLEWDGFFSTTITNPEPMGKQGRVLHPEQTRVVSVRECARSQGFRDSYRFFGNILDKHRQVGNAVPPPMGAAIGHEIRKCLGKKEKIKEEAEEKK